MEVKEEIDRLKLLDSLEALQAGFEELAKQLLDGGYNARTKFRDAHGFELLTGHPQVVSNLLDSDPDGMQAQERSLLTAVFRLCSACCHNEDDGNGPLSKEPEDNSTKDNRVRTLQIRGVVEFALHVVASEKSNTVEQLAALELLEKITKDGNVCKLLCNRLNFTEKTGKYHNEFTNNSELPPSLVSLHNLFQPHLPADVRDSCARVICNLCSCPRMQRRFVEGQRPLDLSELRDDMDDTQRSKVIAAATVKADLSPIVKVEAVDRLAESVAKFISHADVSPTVANAIVRLSGLSAFRDSTRRCPELLNALVDFKQADAKAKMVHVLAVAVIEHGPNDNHESIGAIEEKAKEMGDAMRCAFQLRLQSRMELLNALNESGDHPCEMLFTELYKAVYSADLQPNGSPGFLNLLRTLRQPDWADAPLKLYSGALRALAKAAEANPGEAAKFLEENGNDLFIKHRALPTAAWLLSKHPHHPDLNRGDQELMLVSAYRLGCALAGATGDAGRANSIRFLQVPRVVDHSVKLLELDQPKTLTDAALVMLKTIGRQPEVCKLLCNKINILPHLNLLCCHGDKGVELIYQYLNCNRFWTRMIFDKEEAKPFYECEPPPPIALLKSLRERLGRKYPLCDQLDQLIDKIEKGGSGDSVICDQ